MSEFQESPRESRWRWRMSLLIDQSPGRQSPKTDFKKSGRKPPVPAGMVQQCVVWVGYRLQFAWAIPRTRLCLGLTDHRFANDTNRGPQCSRLRTGFRSSVSDSTLSVLLRMTSTSTFSATSRIRTLNDLASARAPAAITASNRRELHAVPVAAVTEPQPPTASL